MLRKWRDDPILGPVAAYLHERIEAKINGGIRFRSLPLRPGEPFFRLETLLATIYARFHAEQAKDAVVPSVRVCKEPGCEQPKAGNSPYCDVHRQQRKTQRDANAYRNHPEYNENRKQAAKAGTTRKRVQHHGEIDVTDQTRTAIETRTADSSETATRQQR